ncbi:hypothetical protein BDK51DRAFT_48870 [Blyttiomyces helicus]|uniref:Uncharacterized protein n=1 Tax=Blyttiomyces helicus TaxID=388810 RepID=A0A4P9VY88_9FUNG|nr:hypothetical protein BDK51DRAFT_48870 [Blyttiomyces helicus]|eukprot:RKO84729.1 hypothetical protein BDK51DRAFT_48870 [Blyttiomyces helicus]
MKELPAMSSQHLKNHSPSDPPAPYLNSDPQADSFSPLPAFSETPPKPPSIASFYSTRSRLRTLMEDLSRPRGSPNKQLPAETVSSESTASAPVRVTPASPKSVLHTALPLTYETPSIDNFASSSSSSRNGLSRSMASARARLTSESMPSLRPDFHRDADADAERAENDALSERSSSRKSSRSSKTPKRGRVPNLLRLAPRPTPNDVVSSPGASSTGGKKRNSLNKG